VADKPSEQPFWINKASILLKKVCSARTKKSVQLINWIVLSEKK
jgi:hypothetical protein